MDPDIIIMGESNSNDSEYASYPDIDKIRPNSACDIILECTLIKRFIIKSQMRIIV